MKNRDPQVDNEVPRGAGACKPKFPASEPVAASSATHPLQPSAVTSTEAINPPPWNISASAQPSNNRRVALLAPPTDPEVNTEVTPLSSAGRGAAILIHI